MMADQVFFTQLREIAQNTAGIHLKPGKEGLILARVAKRMQTLGMTSLRQYVQLLQNDGSGEEIQQYIDAIATNFTSFFRENDHFDVLEVKVLEWLRRGQTRFRFWSTACSTGEEPYSMVIRLREILPENDVVDWKVLASDISSRALYQAIAGRYEVHRLKQIPAAVRNQSFILHSAASRPYYEVVPEVRNKLTFARINLSKPPFPMRGPMDVIFCRNVMIYFNQAVRQKLLHEMERLLKPGGILIMGHAEPLASLATSLKPIRSSVYIKP
jgi:chemotaxis protein methyltransferase CheR